MHQINLTGVSFNLTVKGRLLENVICRITIDELLLEIIGQLTGEKCLSTIDNVLIESEFNMDDIRRKFNSKDKLEIGDIRRLV